MFISDALQSWADYRAKLRKLKLVSAPTLTNQLLITMRLREGLGHIELEALRKSDIELWAGERLLTCAPITVRGELNVLRQILNWHVDEGKIAKRPALPTVKVPNVEQDLPSDAAFLWVLGNVTPNISRALELMMLVGLSPKELERVQVQDAVRAWPPGTVIPADRFGQALNLCPPPIVGLGIGMRPGFEVKQESRKRIVPLNGRAVELWGECTMGMQPETAPFPKVGTMQKAIKRALEEHILPPIPPAGIEKVTPKMMRKWFASKVAADNDVPEHVLQRLLGHAPGSKITRKHYVRSTERQATAAVEGLRA
jgi:integrase